MSFSTLQGDLAGESDRDLLTVGSAFFWNNFWNASSLKLTCFCCSDTCCHIVLSEEGTTFFQNNGLKESAFGERSKVGDCNKDWSGVNKRGGSGGGGQDAFLAITAA